MTHWFQNPFAVKRDKRGVYRTLQGKRVNLHKQAKLAKDWRSKHGKVLLAVGLVVYETVPPTVGGTTQNGSGRR